MNKHFMAAIGFAVAVGGWVYDAHSASNVTDVRFSGNLLERVTPEWLAQAKVKHADQLAYLRKLNDDNHLPEGTLPTMWVVESMCGELNITNGHGYTGHFQLGGYEQKVYGCDRPKDLKCAAEATVRLLRDYHLKFQGYATHKVDWSQRTRTDFYDLHRSGFWGAAEQYNVLLGGKYSAGRFLRNIRVNTPKSVAPLLFDGTKLRPGISEHDATAVFYQAWDYELNRIWDAIK